MIGIPRVDLEIDNLAADIAKKLNLAKMPAILGDQIPGSTTAAQLYDPTLPGNVWVLELTSNGYSTKKSVRGPTSSTVPMRAGMPILLKYDIDGKLAIDKIDFTAEQAAGNNPLAANASDAQANAFVATSSITTLLSTPTAPPSTNVALFGWKPIQSKTLYDFQGALVDLSSFIPIVGQHRVAVIFVKSDFATVETFASTAKSTSDPITIADIQEAITASTTGSTAVWGWRLHDAQTTIVDADRLIDLRGPWNIATSTTLLDAVILAPGSDTRNIITPTGDFISLVARAGSGTPSKDILRIQNNAGSSTWAKFTKDGVLILENSAALAQIMARGLSTGRGLVAIDNAGSIGSLLQFLDANSAKWEFGITAAASTDFYIYDGVNGIVRLTSYTANGQIALLPTAGVTITADNTYVTPAALLHLYRNSTDALLLLETVFTNSKSTLRMSSTRSAGGNNANGDVIALFDLWGKNNSTNQAMAWIAAIYTGDGTTRKGNLVFYTSNTSTPAERLRITEDKVKVVAGASSGYAALGGAAFDHFADAGNSTTVETDLYSDTLAASILNTDGDKIEGEYAGIYVTSATASRQLKVYFGGTVIFDSGAITSLVIDQWNLHVFIIRDSSSSVRCTVTFTNHNTTLASSFSATVYTAVSGLTLTNTQILKITGQAGGAGAASNDIVAKMGTVQWLSAA